MGIGAGGLALSSTAGSWSIIQPAEDGKSELNVDQVDNKDAGQLGGVNYIQSSEPSSPSQGETWLNTDSGKLNVYADLGSGADWHPVPPAQVLDEATLFDGSGGETVSATGGIEISGGSLSLSNSSAVDGFEDGDISEYEGNTSAFSVQSSTVYDGTYALEGSSGFDTIASTSGLSNYPEAGDNLSIRFYYPDTNLRTNKIFFATQDASSPNDNGYSVVINGDNSPATFGIQKDGSTLSSSTFTLSSYTGEWLEVLVDWNTDGSIDATFKDSSGNTITTVSATDSKYTSGGIGFATQTSGGAPIWDLYKIGDIDATSGSATISWPSPTDVQSWDLATFQRTLDGETVTVDVLEGMSGTTAEIADLTGSANISETDRVGVIINPNKDLIAIDATVGMNYGGVADTAYLIEHSTESVLYSTDISGVGTGDTVTMTAPMKSGSDYRVVIGTDGSSNMTPGQNTSPGYPNTSTDVDVTAGFLTGGTPDSALVWDHITARPETVPLSDIGQNMDISTLSTDAIIALRANLSRNDTSNNPTLDYVARRYTR